MSGSFSPLDGLAIPRKIAFIKKSLQQVLIAEKAFWIQETAANVFCLQNFGGKDKNDWPWSFFPVHRRLFKFLFFYVNMTTDWKATDLLDVSNCKLQSEIMETVGAAVHYSHKMVDCVVEALNRKEQRTIQSCELQTRWVTCHCHTCKADKYLNSCKVARLFPVTGSNYSFSSPINRVDETFILSRIFPPKCKHISSRMDDTISHPHGLGLFEW